MRARTILLIALVLVAGCGRRDKSAGAAGRGAGATAAGRTAAAPVEVVEPATTTLDRDLLDLAGFQRTVQDLATIEDDILLFLWKTGQDSVWKAPHQPLVESIEAIRSAQSGLAARAISPERDLLRRRFVATLDTLVACYETLERGGPRDPAVSAQFAVGNQGIRSVFRALSESFPMQRMMGMDSTQLDAVHAAAMREDDAAYRSAEALVAKGDTVKGYDAFAALAAKAAGQPLEHRCLVRMADCLLRNPLDAKMRAAGHVLEKEAVPALARVLDSGRYSPVLLEAWRKWRVAEQFQHGGSKLSDIPNREYDAKRRQVMTTVRHHLREQPDDYWARFQYLALAQQDIIRREGPYEAGNQFALEWASLYPQ